MGKTKKKNKTINTIKQPINKGTDILSLVGKYRKCIMGFAALYILLFHEHTYIFSPGNVFYDIENGIKTTGFMGTDIFFLLSGLGLTYSIRKSNLINFYYKRFRRIIFPFVCMGIIKLLFSQLPIDKNPAWTFEDFIGNVTGFNFFTKNICSFLWFVPAICIFYLLFPLYNKLIGKAADKITFTSVVVCVWLFVTMLCTDIVTDMGRGDIYGFINRIPVFVIGVLLGYIAQGKKLYITKLGWVLVLLVNAIGMYLSVKTNFNDWQLLVPAPNCFLPNLMLSVTLVFILAKVFDALSKVLIGRGVNAVFGFYGMMSLEFYCVQEYFGLIIRQNFFALNDVPMLLDLIVLAAVTVASLAVYFAEKGFWFVVEFPFKRTKNKNA